MSVNVRKLIIGQPLASSDVVHQRLSKAKALAVFSSDALSSTAYATEAILLVLIAAGTGALGASMWIAIGIGALLIVVATSYYQTIHAYPNGGGAYIVSKENIGDFAGLTAAASLLIDYTLTVAVSVSAGVAALTSAFEALEPYRVIIALLIIVFITVMNLRGVKESGTFFAIPTYMFIVGIFIMLGAGLLNVITGNATPVTPPSPEVLREAAQHASTLTGAGLIFLLFRGFAGGCTALTGVEAISNGIPAFKPPESDNAGKTLLIMVSILVTMFLGITFLANTYQVVAYEGMETTVLSQLGGAIFGRNTPLFYYLQFATLFILSLAANTAYADFPRLASLIAVDRYLPRQLTSLGDRLVFSNGIISLAVLSSILVLIFNAREHSLLPLYAVGVFLSFTLSQSGMVIHWMKEKHREGFSVTGSWRFKIGLNAFGAVCTFIVLIILLVTKFVEGAWIVAISIPVLMFIFTRIHKHYNVIAESLSIASLPPLALTPDAGIMNEHPVVVLMNSLNRSSLQALEYGLSISRNVRATVVNTNEASTRRLQQRWQDWGISIPLDVVESPYRELGQPLVDYLHEIDQEFPSDIPTAVILPEFVVRNWYERLLHNQTAVAIRAAFYRDQIERGRGRPVITVPYRIGEKLYEPIAPAITEVPERPITASSKPATSH